MSLESRNTQNKKIQQEQREKDEQRETNCFKCMTQSYQMLICVDIFFGLVRKCPIAELKLYPNMTYSLLFTTKNRMSFCDFNFTLFGVSFKSHATLSTECAILLVACIYYKTTCGKLLAE